MMATENFFMCDNKELIAFKYSFEKEEVQKELFAQSLSCI